MPNIYEAKDALDKVISKSRIHLYKPIQIAEILYRSRVYGDIDISDVKTYITKSRHWRDDMTKELLHQVCTSSAKFQDNLFDKNAMPPELLQELDSHNKLTNGGVEAYIYKKFAAKHYQIATALSYCLESDKTSFDVKKFIDSFWSEPGLKRSVDKIYEIIVYALFATLVEAMHLKVEISIAYDKINLLQEFSDFSEKVMCLDILNNTFTQDAKVYRIGVTNAADCGLDMYSNWGPAIQIKHLTLDTSLAKNIVSEISSDRVIIVCKDAESDVIVSILNQIGWTSHIQSIVTETDLINWYEKALRGKFANIIGDSLLGKLCGEIENEFPSVFDIPDVLKKRHYERIDDAF